MTQLVVGGARHRAATAPQSLRAAWPALLGLCLTQLVEMVDNSILNVAVPVIGRDLNASPTDLQWIVGAYSLTFGGLLMVGGLSLIHISEPTRRLRGSRMPSSA